MLVGSKFKVELVVGKHRQEWCPTEQHAGNERRNLPSSLRSKKRGESGSLGAGTATADPAGCRQGRAQWQPAWVALGGEKWVFAEWAVSCSNRLPGRGCWRELGPPRLQQPEVKATASSSGGGKLKRDSENFFTKESYEGVKTTISENESLRNATALCLSPLKRRTTKKSVYC